MSVRWLLAFTAAHGCHDWPTWRVQAKIIRPACHHAATRCRYAELAAACAVGGGGGIGPATVFISHCWGAKWGSLVAAVVCGAPPDQIMVRPLRGPAVPGQ